MFLTIGSKEFYADQIVRAEVRLAGTLSEAARSLQERYARTAKTCMDMLDKGCTDQEVWDYWIAA